MNNSLLKILNIEEVKKQIAKTPSDEICILLSNYSINVQRTYEDGEELNEDFNELETLVGHSLQVNDYDDLICDPHGILND